MSGQPTPKIAILKTLLTTPITPPLPMPFLRARQSPPLHPRFTGQNLEQNKIFYTRIEALAKKHGCTPIQIALTWVLHQGDDVVPIPGTTKMKNLDENIGAVRVKLDIEYLKEISDAVPVNEVAGVRIHGIFARVSYEFSDTPLPKDSK
ncbi:hypothetical protein ACSBR1_018281 [Camellia fascicularis]